MHSSSPYLCTQLSKHTKSRDAAKATSDKLYTANIGLPLRTCNFTCIHISKKSGHPCRKLQSTTYAAYHRAKPEPSSSTPPRHFATHRPLHFTVGASRSRGTSKPTPLPPAGRNSQSTSPQYPTSHEQARQNPHPVLHRHPRHNRTALRIRLRGINLTQGPYTVIS